MCRKLIFASLVLGLFVSSPCVVAAQEREPHSGSMAAGFDVGAFVPSLAVLGGMVLAFVGVAFLIYFIHHISVSIQASIIIAAAAQETVAAVDQLKTAGVI